jgi:hypothetical protein
MNLMARNAIMSALSGTTWVIKDQMGNGAFAHKPLWDEIDSLLTIRDEIQSTSQGTSPKITVVLDDKRAAYIKDPSLLESIFDSLLSTMTQSGIQFSWKTLDSFL